MTKQDSRQQVSDPRQLTIDELEKVAGGHGVAIPPEGFNILADTTSTNPAPTKPVKPTMNKIL